MKKELLVTKCNHLVEASYKLTLDEQRLLYLTMCQLDPMKPIPKDNYFEIKSEDFCEVFGTDRRLVYDQMKNASNELAERWIRTHDARCHSKIRWVFGVKYHDGEGRVTLGFSPPIIPYLTMLKKQFTSLKISQIAQLKSVYSIRLLEFVMQFKSTGKFVISLEKFRDRLGLKNEYSEFFNLRLRVIEPAITELSKKSDIHIEWKAVRGKGRKVTGLEFTIKNLPAQKDAD